MWHPWKVAINPTRPKKERRRWRRRKNGIGYYKRGLYNLVRDKYSFYEIGIVVPKSKKIFVVYYKFTRLRLGRRKSIYKTLLKNKEVTAEVNNIVKRHGAIWIRRGYLNINGELMFSFIRQYVRTNFNYPWRSHDPKTRVNRFVKKGKGFLISGNLFLQSSSGSVLSSKRAASRQDQPSKTPSSEINDQSKQQDAEEQANSRGDYDANENAPDILSAGFTVIGNEPNLRASNKNDKSPSVKNVKRKEDGKAKNKNCQSTVKTTSGSASLKQDKKVNKPTTPKLPTNKIKNTDAKERPKKPSSAV